MVRQDLFASQQDAGRQSGRCSLRLHQSIAASSPAAKVNRSLLLPWRLPSFRSVTPPGFAWRASEGAARGSPVKDSTQSSCLLVFTPRRWPRRGSLTARLHTDSPKETSHCHFNFPSTSPANVCAPPPLNFSPSFFPLILFYVAFVPGPSLADSLPFSLIVCAFLIVS